MKTKLVAQVSWIMFLVSAVAEWGCDIDLPLNPPLWLAIAAVVFFATNAPAALTTNSWTNTNGGKWETNANWSVSDPSLNNAAVMITNRFGPAVTSKSITIDAITVSSSPGSMSISNLTVSAPIVTNGLMHSQGLNELLIKNTVSTPFTVVSQLLLTKGSVMSVTNSAVTVKGGVADDGYLELDKGATLLSTNGPEGGACVGCALTAQMAVTGGVWTVSYINIGQNAGSTGLLEFSSGTISVVGEVISLGENPGAAGTITMSGGTMNTPYYADIYFGSFGGAGSIFMSGGNWIGPTATMVLTGDSQLNIPAARWRSNLSASMITEAADLRAPSPFPAVPAFWNPLVSVGAVPIPPVSG